MTKGNDILEEKKHSRGFSGITIPKIPTKYGILLKPKTTEGQTDFFTNVLPNGSSNTEKKFAVQLVGGRSEIGPRPFLTDVPYLKI